MQRKIEAALNYANMTKTDLARKFGFTQQNMSKRIARGKFTYDELVKIGEFLGAEYHCYFEFPDGTKIGE